MLIYWFIGICVLCAVLISVLTKLTFALHEVEDDYEELHTDYVNLQAEGVELRNYGLDLKAQLEDLDDELNEFERMVEQDCSNAPISKRPVNTFH